MKEVIAANGHECLTVQETGWSGKANGALLDLAEGNFDVLVTVDTNLKYQQNLTGRKLAVVILRARSNRLTALIPHFPACLKALASVEPGEIIYVGTQD